MLESLNMLSPSRLSGSIWSSSSSGNGVSMLRLTSGMPASALLRSLNRLVLESSGKSSEKGEQCRLEGVGVRSFRTRLVTTPCHLAHQDSHHPCPNHPQAHSPALESVFFAVSSTSPSFAGFLPLTLIQWRGPHDRHARHQQARVSFGCSAEFWITHTRAQMMKC